MQPDVYKLKEEALADLEHAHYVYVEAVIEYAKHSFIDSKTGYESCIDGYLEKVEDSFAELRKRSKVYRAYIELTNHSITQ